MTQDDEKKLLYRRITQRSPSVVLARMKVHGFWPKDEPLPQDPAGEAAERAAVEKEIAEIQKRWAEVKDPGKALHAERIRRWEASKKRRAERKAERLRAEDERRAQWAVERHGRLVHLGEGVSGALSREDALGDLDRLRSLDLPVLRTGAEVASAMGITLSRLRWLTFHRRGATLVHYHRYDIPKKTGGRRHISAPKPALDGAQRYILENILHKIPSEPAAHGFLPGRSIVTNATEHVASAVVVNLDVKDFFPSFTFRRVKGLFQKRLGYGEAVATVLALLCTEPPRVPARFEGRRLWIALGERSLPQGACTSPAITNLLCRRLDRRLSGLASAMGFAYTRYADDLTFSGDDGAAVGKLLAIVRGVLRQEGLAENGEKTRIMRHGRRQEVTGVVVNEKLGVTREERRRLRAILHNCAKNGLARENRGAHPRFADHLKGKVSFVTMVDPERGKPLVEALDRALAAG
ncbi:MAG: reverse transcriptase domain-containing protein [Acidobacteriota bacterium]